MNDMYMDTIYLKFDKFEVNVRDCYQKLRDNEALVDVTLATDDGKHIKAHKIILAAGSMFFREIFISNQHSIDMLVYLKGVKSVALVHVINFIYNGEIQLDKEDLPMFLETAQELGVEGLLQGNVEDAPNYEDITHNVKETKNGNCEIIDKIEENSNSLEERSSSLIKNNELDLKLEPLIEKGDEGVWKCKVCGKTNKKRKELKRHAEIHLEGVSHICHICGNAVSTRGALRKHISEKHSDLHTCDICGKTGMNRKAYSDHNEKYHTTDTTVQLEKEREIGVKEVINEHKVNFDALGDIVSSFIPNHDGLSELDLRIDALIENTEGVWKCKVCGKTNKKKKDLKRHAETHLEGVSHICHICGNTGSTREALRNHMADKHSGLHNCDVCGKTGMQRKAYYYHKDKFHAQKFTIP